MLTQGADAGYVQSTCCTQLWRTANQDERNAAYSIRRCGNIRIFQRYLLSRSLSSLFRISIVTILVSTMVHTYSHKSRHRYSRIILKCTAYCTPTAFRTTQHLVVVVVVWQNYVVRDAERCLCRRGSHPA